VEFESTRMCELLVGLPDVNVLAVVDVAGEPLRVHVETREPRPVVPGLRRSRLRNYRVRVLLYAGRPNWDRLATVTPR
jgi:hypothetical protein